MGEWHGFVAVHEKSHYYYASGGAELQNAQSKQRQLRKGNTEVGNLAGEARLACYAVNISKSEG